jgi:predicted MFS family arabinose efflux permease
MSRAAGFWLLSAVMAFLLAAASAPSPLYAVYAARWGFSSTTLTAIFAVYALALLAALLTAGELSDHLGRRPVLTIALAVQTVAMVAFLLADGVVALYVARILQGIGTGVATGALSAWLIDLEPSDAPGLGSLVGAVAPLAGLAAGAVGSALLVQYGPHPLRLVYWLLTGVFLVALVAVQSVPDDVPRRPGWLATLRPDVGVPAAARPLYAASAPSLVATWALGGLYLSLGPSLAISLLAEDSRIAGGFVIAALAGAGAVASVAARSRPPRAIVVGGSLILVAGVGITLIAVAADSPALLYAGSVVAGVGFGPAFSGVFRSLAPLAQPQARSALLAAIYVVSYLAFSLPAVAAGVAAAHWSLRSTTYIYGVTVMALALATTIAVARRQPQAA